MSEIIKKKELIVVKKEVARVVKRAQNVEIKDVKGLQRAADVLSDIKRVQRELKERKEIITKPLNAAMKGVRDLFRPFETDLAEAESIYKKKAIAFKIEQDEIEEKQKAKLAARVDKGTLKVETAAKKAAELPTIAPSFQGSRGLSEFRKIKKVRVIEIKEIPSRYFRIDEVLLRHELLELNRKTGKLGELIPGAELFEEETIASR